MSLLIFFLPFFQMCSDENIKSSRFIKSYSAAKTNQEKEIAFQKTKKDFSLSGYDLAMSFEPVFSGFTAIMFLNITIFICVLRKHYNLIFFCLINLFIIITSLIALALSFPFLTEIRYGLILCLTNASLLFYFIYRDQEITYGSS
ncbi:hypothetical protein [Flavobacterium gyeonganense]|uniref:Uncharacterized protein n=1 Tax=Flavobacterium gyeonganense TaxID=1310418 RepID=A0ABV5HD44_9FLAO|nr:hypothetical protein [Flavobacterium gyeonganense]